MTNFIRVFHEVIPSRRAKVENFEQDRARNRQNNKAKGKLNWAIWKFQISITLKASGSWDVNTEDVKKLEREAGKSEMVYQKRLKEW